MKGIVINTILQKSAEGQVIEYCSLYFIIISFLFYIMVRECILYNGCILQGFGTFIVAQYIINFGKCFISIEKNVKSL